MRSGKGISQPWESRSHCPSQWSLTFEVRKSSELANIGVIRIVQSQWSLTFEVRKRYTAALEREAKERVAMEPDL